MRKIYHVLQPFVEELRERLIEFYGENLAAAIVFGSYARGEVRFASDLDILIILNECSLRRRERQREFEREVEERLRYEPNLPISPIILTREEARKFHPIYLDIVDHHQVLVGEALMRRLVEEITRPSGKGICGGTSFERQEILENCS